MLDHKSAVKTEPLGLHIVVNEVLEALRAIHIDAAALRLGAAKKAEFHGVWSDMRLFLVILTCHTRRCIATRHPGTG
jgi:hypothetical protein